MNWTLFIKPLPTELLTDYPYINAQLEDINLKLLGPQNHKIPILIELQQHLMDKREKLAKDGYDNHHISRTIDALSQENNEMIKFHNNLFIKNKLYELMIFAFSISIFKVIYEGIPSTKSDYLSLLTFVITTGILYSIVNTFTNIPLQISPENLFSKQYIVESSGKSKLLNTLGLLLFIVLPILLIMDDQLKLEPVLIFAMLFFACALYINFIKINVYADVIEVYRFGIKTTIPWHAIKGLKAPLFQRLKKYPGLAALTDLKFGAVTYINKKGKIRTFTVPYFHINSSRLLGDVIRHTQQHSK